ncbi:metal ABC transporter solute-binding protein, Zn/Mn family [Paraliobacillus sediminis]|uniref:metal ABC transporter solute-binding protein, Zn/Mn family n=1 Tax=Paraliobacillus sediminis TaxID=1885916 RepID=UPI000E3C6C5F|nr:zinc ABC transporter substrate-binding protein [Paraliobacillus sediminis]
MRKHRIIIGMFTLLAILILGGCGATETKEKNDEVTVTAEQTNEVLTIYTTLYPLAYFSEQIGADHVEVESILPLGADAHTYEPTSKTMIDIAEADAFIYNIAEMETYAVSIEEALENEDVTILEAAGDIPLLDHVHDHEGEDGDHEAEEGDHDHEGEDNDHEAEEVEHDHEEADHEEEHHDHGDKDPHIWLDPIRSIELAENIKNQLVELMPSEEKEFEENFQDLKTRLEELDISFRDEIENTARKEILVTHAAYGYWEEAYGIEQVAISGLSSTNEPSQKQLEEVIDVVNDHGIRYLLFEQNIEPRVAKVIQNETDVASLNIHNLSVLTEADAENNEDYFTIMNQNLETLLIALEE